MTVNKVLIALLNAGPFLSQQMEGLLVFCQAGRKVVRPGVGEYVCVCVRDVPEGPCVLPRRKSPFHGAFWLSVLPNIRIICNK